MKKYSTRIFFPLFIAILFISGMKLYAQDDSKESQLAYLSKYRNFPVNWWEKYGSMDCTWFASGEAITVAENIITWQTDAGGWPLMNTSRESWTGDKTAIGPWGRHGTFIYSTTNEIRFLARVYKETGKDKYREALLKGMDYIFNAQTLSGGWPKSYPVRDEDYHQHITFNDGAMINVMSLLKEIIEDEVYSFFPSDLMKKVEKRYEMGIDCILKCQIVVNGKLTAWCQQHDEVTYEPKPGRTFEPAAISGSESVEVARFLMEIETPSPKLKKAIESAVSWIIESKIEGIRVVTVPDSTFEKRKIDRIVVKEPGPVLWARYYEIETNNPIFFGRDGVKKYTMAEIEQERRTGYAWYGTWAAGLNEEYKEWAEK